MNPTTLSAIESTFAASKAGSIHFGQVVDRLMAAGVEAYHVDYRAARVTYYLPDDETHTLGFEPPAVPVAPAFNAEGMVAAIRGAQAGTVKYPEFKRLSQAAGCASYTVWIAGRHVTYYGRKGEMHVERFPD
ncbi:DUF1398 domain-containing protein [Hylemonella gracilis]|jgi:uncharacterized protein YbcV (DUF1398 family)|uniref:DUF1398 domain-containing protein n=1 Tax=Hylemonella gracilis TaxID=80880 RepID=A0A4P6UMU0_9BURK|nr:DUF1398 family protein [Hylemonella gracilis]QBK05914.1 DUF1398 domain-containing protein [Hylemonella gracilis]